ncbi:ADP-ribosyl-(dinitrogen reductase) hydrolase [Alishewanella sp. 16-MA]|uniref:ADP-ribosyl-(Dinitrogen reductase) hydrolase n=1 Tax=Alishewanella maricola TaxID=2795740 RepID=A0ABS8C5M5_9ALTE|nr:ADP-ribosyl-(dinitrogen reductase) hydrolase [Alishewanella maricola]MCB5227646.1 ADP-ribosyl-(dinitrogen reductase) hydrolase [Alishewanella maricola]
MAIYISDKVKNKIQEKHGLTLDEVYEAISGRLAGFLADTREEHKSDPPTYWFIGSTDFGKKIKVAFIYKDDTLIIRTAYEANPRELAIYNKYA